MKNVGYKAIVYSFEKKLKCKQLSYALKCIYLYTKNVHRNIFNSKKGNNPNKRWCIHTMEYSTAMKMNNHDYIQQCPQVRKYERL